MTAGVDRERIMAGAAQQSPAAMGARQGSIRLAASDRPFFLVAHAPHRGPQSRRPRRPDDRLSASEPVPRRHHRGARAEPDDSGGHHRGGGRRIGRGRHRLDHDRPGQASAARSRTDRARPRRATKKRSSSPSIQSASGRFFIGSSRRLTLARASTTATAGCCWTHDRFPRTASWCVPICLIPPSAAALLDRLAGALRNFFATPSAPRPENPWLVDGMTVPEVRAALLGKTEVAARINNEGETIVSVAVPIQYMMATRGALQLSTQGGDIDRVIASERWAIFRFFVVLASVMLVLSLVARQHHRRAGAAACDSGRARAARHSIARANSRLHGPHRRDRAPFAGAA